jgi:hypothetical protein
MEAALRARLTAASRPLLMPSGKWQKPLLSGRKLADLRKDFLRKGLAWDVPPPRAPRTARVKPNKLHKPDRPEVREKRRLNIEKSLKDMPKMIDQMHKNAREERKKLREKSKMMLTNEPLKKPNLKLRKVRIDAKRLEKAKTALALHEQRLRDLDATGNLDVGLELLRKGTIKKVKAGSTPDSKKSAADAAPAAAGKQ